MWRFYTLICFFKLGLISFVNGNFTSLDTLPSTLDVSTDAPLITGNLTSSSRGLSTRVLPITTASTSNRISSTSSTDNATLGTANATSSTVSVLLSTANATSSTASVLLSTVNATASSTVLTTTKIIIVTEKPAAPGEFQSQVEMGCSYTSEKYNSNYKNKDSDDYKVFTNKIFTSMKSSLLQKLLRLIEIIFNSLDPGSVVASMTFVMASTSSLAGSNLSALVIAAAIDASNNSIVVNKITVIQAPTEVPSMKTNPPSFPNWGVGLIVIASAIIALIFTSITVAMVKFCQSKVKESNKFQKSRI